MSQNFEFYLPSRDDGWSVSQLVANCPPLDTNSVYCNLLQCHHFSATSVAVREADALVGFISGYLVPNHPETLFVWQVAVAEQARGHGLATKMLEHILNRETCAKVRYIETTITQDNQASWALFRRIAANVNAPLSREELFTKDKHFNGQHDTETLVTIGPMTPHTAQ